MRKTWSIRAKVLSGLWRLVLSLLATGSVASGVQLDQLVRDFPVATNLAGLRRMVNREQGCVCSFNLEGTVLATDDASGTLFFKDTSGTEILEMDLQGRSLRPGQSIRLQGTNYVMATAIGLSLGKVPVVDNDGAHAEARVANTISLKAGLYPFQVRWFNYTWKLALSAEYAGPDFATRRIPAARLYHLETDGQTLAHGLQYRCYEGEWQEMPRFESLTPVKSGIARTIDPALRTRDEKVSLTYDGFLLVNRDGPYTFYLQSDDGSQLFLYPNPVQLTITGAAAIPAPRPIAIHQPLQDEAGAFWAVVEGRVSFVGRQKNGVVMELVSEGATMRIKLCNADDVLPVYLLGCKVRVTGVCLDTSGLGGAKVADTVVAPGWDSVRVQKTAESSWEMGRNLSLGDCAVATADNPVVCVQGKIYTSNSGRTFTLEDGTNSIPVEFLQTPPGASAAAVQCEGVLETRNEQPVLTAAIWRELPLEKEAVQLPVLTTAAQVQQLKRAESQRGYHAKLSGVVTWVAENRDCIVLQDATRGVFVGLQPAWIWATPKVGEKLEIEGSCVSGSFSPFVVVSQARRLGMGVLPAPMHPTWDQLIGGSMDSQYIEIRGLVTRIHGDQMELLLPGGEISIEFHPPVPAAASYLNSVVRIQGVMFAKWNESTLQVTTAHPMWFGSATICLDTPPAADPFDVPKMQSQELMQYDVQRNTFQRVRISGQFLQAHAGTGYLTDNGFGVRIEPVLPVNLEPGDQVEVVGLVELGGPSPILRQALVRKTAPAALPPPQPLDLARTNVNYDSSRVWVEGMLLETRTSGAERILEMQAGLKRFVARLPQGAGVAGSLPVGSRLKLTGIFSDQRSNRHEGQGINAFELLLNSPASVVLVSRPPWWTLNRLLTMVGVLATGLALAFIWITLLRRQVERRSAQLKREISERQRAEQERAIEQERSRIALDLHDDLGSRLTAISMLAMTNQGRKLTAEASQERLQLIGDKARQTVTTLDGLVWAVDPKNDTLAALAEYLASFVEEFLARTGIACYVEMPHEYPNQAIAAEARHNILLAVREALNNAVRHGQPGTIRLQLKFSESGLSISIQDDGRGFDPEQKSSGNGLPNLRERMRQVNGHCQIESVAGKGTTITLSLPWERLAAAPGDRQV